MEGLGARSSSSGAQEESKAVRWFGGEGYRIGHFIVIPSEFILWTPHRGSAGRNISRGHPRMTYLPILIHKLCSSNGPKGGREMSRKRFAPEQIIRVMRHVEVAWAGDRQLT